MLRKTDGWNMSKRPSVLFSIFCLIGNRVHRVLLSAQLWMALTHGTSKAPVPPPRCWSPRDHPRISWNFLEKRPLTRTPFSFFDVFFCFFVHVFFPQINPSWTRAVFTKELHQTLLANVWASWASGLGNFVFTPFLWARMCSWRISFRILFGGIWRVAKMNGTGNHRLWVCFGSKPY